MPPKAKRIKYSEPSSSQEVVVDGDEILLRCHLNRLPLELLAEILSYTPSPRDILALARTSKHFCSILVNNNATLFIWRDARARASPRIPDAPPNFSEALYATMLFDHKLCEVCQRKTKEAYHSFALRGRLCDKPKCLVEWRGKVLRRVSPRDQVEYPEFLQWLPRMEQRDAYYADKIDVREIDWQQAVNEYKKVHLLGEEAVAEYAKQKQKIADHLPTMIEFYTQLLAWSADYEKLRKEVSSENLRTTGMLAGQYGWPNARDLLRAPTYSTFHNSKNRNLERISMHEFVPLIRAVTQEIADLRTRESRRLWELAQQQRHKQVRRTWDHMKTKDSPTPTTHIVPHLNEFRKLSVVKIYEKNGPGVDTRTLQDAFVQSVLEENLEQWRDQAKTALAAVLGFPKWKYMSKYKLHPVDRLTARFRCKRCDEANGGKKVLDDGGMDFAEACAHVCGHKKSNSKERWSAERFAPDQRAIDAIMQVLALCKALPDDAYSIRVADNLGDRVQCQSCACIMDIYSVARHCKRHDNCSFTLADAPADPPVEYGVTERLLKATGTAASDRDSKVYVCQHCTSRAQGASGSRGQDAKGSRLMSFNGLRSHVKEKHSILNIADEDFFRPTANESA